MKYRTLLPALLLLAGCSHALKPAQFIDQKPDFDPLAFFSGHTQSWGMVEQRDGAPNEGFASDCHGTRDAAGNLDLVQNFSFEDGKKPERRWHFTQVDAHHFIGTANDVDGVARGEAYGNLFHWRYTLELHPGNPLFDVGMEQWMYLQADGTMLNRAVIRKLGIPVAMVTEHFTHPAD